MCWEINVYEDRMKGKEDVVREDGEDGVEASGEEEGVGGEQGLVNEEGFGVGERVDKVGSVGRMGREMWLDKKGP
jgi:hypothetical protein